MKKRIALYGKGGIGKTTVAVNTALCMARRGYRVLLVGCDPKQDTTRLLTKQPLISILERYDGPCGPSLQDGLIANPRPNLWCCEAGGPKPGVGCAGRGIAIALNALEKAGCAVRRFGRCGVRRLFNAGYKGVCAGTLYCDIGRTGVAVRGQ